MNTMTPVEKNDPVWLAWLAYKQTEGYPNTLRWATHPEHAEGSLWAAFVQGFRAALDAAPTTEEP